MRVVPSSFASHDAFLEWKRKLEQETAHRYSSARSGKKRMHQVPLAPGIVYEYREFHCVRGGSFKPKAKKPGTATRQRSSKKIGCPAHSKLRASKDGYRLEIVSINLKHICKKPAETIEVSDGEYSDDTEKDEPRCSKSVGQSPKHSLSHPLFPDATVGNLQQDTVSYGIEEVKFADFVTGKFHNSTLNVMDTAQLEGEFFNMSIQVEDDIKTAAEFQNEEKERDEEKKCSIEVNLQSTKLDGKLGGRLVVYDLASGGENDDLNEVPVEIAEIKLEKIGKGRGRPEGSRNIAHEKKYIPQKFTEKASTKKNKLLLHSLFDVNTVQLVVHHNKKISNELLPEKFSMMPDCFYEEIEFVFLKKHFKKDAFERSTELVEKKRGQKNKTYKCRECKEKLVKEAVFCEGCLFWFNFDCVSLTEPPSTNDDWFCSDCRSGKQ